MQKLSIIATKYTPAISSSLDNASITFEGKSYPENTFEFYEPIETYIGQFLDNFKDSHVSVNFDVSYFNSSTSKIFFNIFDMLEESAIAGTKITVKKIDYFDASTKI